MGGGVGRGVGGGLCRLPPARPDAAADPTASTNGCKAFKQEASAAGISRSTIESALSNVAYDDNVISHDRGQRAFGQSFATFSSRHITAYGLKKGKSLLRRYAEPLQSIEQRYGVPGEVLVAIWGLETGYRLHDRQVRHAERAGDARLRLPPHREIP